MKNIKKAFSIIPLCILVTSCHVSPLHAQLVESQIKDQKSLELTLYSGQYAFVREVRSVNLPQGKNQMQISGLSEMFVPESLQIQSLNAPKELAILEQSFHHDVIDPYKLLSHFVGKKVKIERWNQYQDRKEVLEGTLLSNNGEPIYEINGQIYLGLDGTRIFPEIPEGMSLKPSLVVDFDNQSAKTHDLELSYLAYGLNWTAHYVLHIQDLSNTGNLSCWVSLENQSQADFRNAKLRLLAGNLNQNTNYPSPMPMMTVSAKADMAPYRGGMPEFQNSQAFEFHTYDYSAPVSLEKFEKKQVEFIKTKSIAIIKKYEFNSQNNYFYQPYPDVTDKKPVDVFVEIQNSKENQLGMAIPAGVVRLFHKPKDGNSFYIGEDRIEHTAEGEKLRLRAGQAFDVVAERRQVDYRQISTQMHESEWEIVLKNQKDEDIEVAVIENLSNNWRILSESQPHEKEQAFRIRYMVKVPKKSDAKLRYRVQIGY